MLYVHEEVKRKECRMKKKVMKDRRATATNSYHSTVVVVFMNEG